MGGAVSAAAVKSAVAAVPLRHSQKDNNVNEDENATKGFSSQRVGGSSTGASTGLKSAAMTSGGEHESGRDGESVKRLLSLNEGDFANYVKNMRVAGKAEKSPIKMNRRRRFNSTSTWLTLRTTMVNADTATTMSAIAHVLLAHMEQVRDMKQSATQKRHWSFFDDSIEARGGSTGDSAPSRSLF